MNAAADGVVSTAVELAASALHWEHLAAEQRRMAAWEESRGLFGGVYRNRAAVYDRTAAGIRMEIQTGVAVCVCCHKPQSRSLLGAH